MSTPRPFPALLAVALVFAAGCSARPPVRSLTDLPTRVRPGQTLYVIDTVGVESRGKLTSLDATGLTIDLRGVPHTFAAPQIRQVQRYGDSLGNGILIGAVVGVAAGALQGVRMATAGALLYGAIGAGIDAAARSREQVYLAPGQKTARDIRVTPLVTARGGAIALNVRY